MSGGGEIVELRDSQVRSTNLETSANGQTITLKSATPHARGSTEILEASRLQIATITAFRLPRLARTLLASSLLRLTGAIDGFSALGQAQAGLAGSREALS
jgi:hypothetical protein